MWYAVEAAFRVGYFSGTQWNKANIGDNSFATGRNAVAIGDYSTAMSLQTAAGTYSFVMGISTTATGNASTAMDHSTLATGNTSFAIGSHTSARAVSSLTILQYNDSILTN